jgi:putative oxidoreductase
MNIVKWFAQVLLSVIFIEGGSSAYLEPGNRPARVAKAGIPEPELAVKINGATMVFAGIALALNFKPKLAAAVLLAALIPTTLVGHPFWQEEEEGPRKMQQTQFAKNLGLIGGLLLVLANRSSAKDEA